MDLKCPNIRLKYGSKGDEVKQMQTLLQSLGYYTQYKADGNWGDGTEQAVRSFQRRYGLDVDGIFGEVTCTKLTSLTKAISQSGTAVFDCEKTSLQYGSTDKEKVTILQKYLKDWGYYTGVVDGDFKDLTREAVKAFQRATGHDADGWFGSKTCPDFVKKVQQEKSKQNTKIERYQVGEIWDNVPPDKRGINATLVVYPVVIYEEEITVNTLELPESTEDTSTTTEYDEETGEELESDDTSSTPQVKTTTVKKLKFKRIGKSSGGNVKGTLNCEGIDLHNGSSGEQVKTLQTGLKQLGHYNGNIDGQYGPVTYNAVVAFQNASGSLLGDGLFGPATCRVFNLKLAAMGGSKGEDDLSYTDDELYLVYSDRIIGFPAVAWDAEGLTMEVNMRLLTSEELLAHIQINQMVRIHYFNDYWVTSLEDNDLWVADGYIEEIKWGFENTAMYLELKIVGFTAFLEQQLVGYGGTKSRYKHLADIIKETQLGYSIELDGMPNDQFTIDASASSGTSSATGSGGGRTVQMSNTDCNPNNRTESDTWADHRCNPPRCTAKSKVAHGNSSRKYATDTASHNSSARELVEYVKSRCQYEYVNGHAYADNPHGQSHCPDNMWKNSIVRGNCADFARMLKCICDVNGYKCIICHIPGHFYNAIWENGGWTVCDLCNSNAYGHANHGNVKPTGTWDNPQPRLWY